MNKNEELVQNLYHEACAECYDLNQLTVDYSHTSACQVQYFRIQLLHCVVILKLES